MKRRFYFVGRGTEGLSGKEKRDGHFCETCGQRKKCFSVRPMGWDIEGRRKSFVCPNGCVSGGKKLNEFGLYEQSGKVLRFIAGSRNPRVFNDFLFGCLVSGGEKMRLLQQSDAREELPYYLSVDLAERDGLLVV